MKSGNLNFLGPSGPLQACNGTAFTNQGKADGRITWYEGARRRMHTQFLNRRERDHSEEIAVYGRCNIIIDFVCVWGGSWSRRRLHTTKYTFGFHKGRNFFWLSDRLCDSELLCSTKFKYSIKKKKCSTGSVNTSDYQSAFRMILQDSENKSL